MRQRMSLCATCAHFDWATHYERDGFHCDHEGCKVMDITGGYTNNCTGYYRQRTRWKRLCAWLKYGIGNAKYQRRRQWQK